MRIINTENAAQEQRRMLSRYAYAQIVTRFLEERGFTAHTDTVNYITGSIRQSDAYFTSARRAPLDISPLLLYYGAANLLGGIAALLHGAKLEITSHGMKIDGLPNLASGIGLVEIIPQFGTSSGLQLLVGAFFSELRFPNAEPWNLAELFGSIPDLQTEYTAVFPDLPRYVIPVESIRHSGMDVERVRLADLGPRNEVSLFDSVPGFRENYVGPHSVNQSEYLILRRRVGRKAELGIFSVSGKRYLPVGHKKGSALVTLEPLIVTFMVLYGLGYLSRYHPQFWNPFVRSDDTGERLLVERFMHIAERILTNLTLNVLEGERLLFINKHQAEMRSEWLHEENELRLLVREEVESALRKANR